MELSAQVDCESIRRASTGDAESRHRLAKSVGQRVYPYIYRAVMDTDLSADLTQDTLVRVLCALGGLRDAERFWPWVYTIAANTTRQHLRSRRREILFSSMSPQWLAEPPLADSHAGPPTGEPEERITRTRSAMDRIQKRYRTALSLRFLEGRSYDEVATSLGCSSVTARTLVFRAKNALRRELAISDRPRVSSKRTNIGKHPRSYR